MKAITGSEGERQSGRSPLKVLAFLQNQWFKDPERMQRMLETTFKGNREEFNKRLLFFGSLTGRRLLAALGQEWCDRIIWENASPLMAGQSSGVFPPDTDHMRAVLEKHRPRVVLLFGRVAIEGFYAQLWRQEVKVIPCCHPAARSNSALSLKVLRDALDRAAAECHSE